MNFTNLVPNIFYKNISDGIRLFVDVLGFRIAHDEINSSRPFCVLSRGTIRINLFEDAALAAEHNPEFRLGTENIAEVYDEISSAHPELLHPNLSKVTLRPWGAKEFAIRDNQLGIIFQEWPKR